MSLVELARGTSSTSFHEMPNAEFVPLKSFGLAFAAVVVCGLCNNFSYCIISGASQNLAKQFGMESQVTLLSSAMNFASLAGTAISTRFLLRLPYYTRVLIAIGMTAIAYVGVAFASTQHGTFAFVLAAIFSMFGSMAQVFGEISNLSFLKAFPPQLIGGWGAGTGLAGIGGGGIYIILSGPLNLSNTVIFAAMAPIVLVYWAAYYYLHAQAKAALRGGAEASQSFKGPAPHSLQQALGGGANLQETDGEADVEGRGPHAPQPSRQSRGPAPATWTNIQAAVGASGSIMFNLVAVYMLEYSIHPGLDDRETLCANKVWFTTMWMCYNVGVTLSRLSVALFRIRRVWILTVLQLCNVIGWTIEVYTGHIRSLPNESGYFVMAGWMVIVGLCGGATYSNCMYLFNRQEGIPDDLRELGINLGFVMSNFGITLATFSFTFFNENITAKSVIYPHGCPKDS